MENFKNIIKKYKIQIPIIQRDYAQGRLDKKATVIRENFLDSIAQVLEHKDSLHLDFVYGSIKHDKFIPLDGQQRLTTLFLLYWYFGKKAKEDVNYLTNFSYETRASSREFCNKLVKCEINFDEENLSYKIKDSSWFLAYWENDPSIRGMLTMIDRIHSKFYRQQFYEDLDNITFNFFELEHFGLDDDLYIKMNARGKALTDFENFKAKFEKHLYSIDASIHHEFSRKIDNEWTDIFWNYGVKDESYLIDKFFMNYFNYITEMIYYTNTRETWTGEGDFNQIRHLYNSTEQIEFFIKSLDKLPFVLESLDGIFSKNEYEDGKICLFDEDVNILQKLILGQNVNIQQKILLYVTISHVLDFDINDNLKDLLRVARNLTYRIRHLKVGYIYYTNDLSFENIQPLLGLFVRLINKDIYSELLSIDIQRSGTGIGKSSLKHEIDKAKIIQDNIKAKKEIFRLEDFRYTRGDIHNFLTDDEIKLAFHYEAIKYLYSQNDSSIIRSMLTISDYTLKIGWTILGDKYYFGKNNNWEIILTATKKRKFFKKYLESFQTNGSTSKIIESYLSNPSEKDWKYYFIKYSEMISSNSDLSKDNNIFSWNGQYSVEKMGGSNLNAYHQNPYIKTVSIKLGVKTYPVQYDLFSHLRFSDIKIYSKDAGWHLYNLSSEQLAIVGTTYSLDEKEDFYILQETNDKDRIEILLDFLTVLGKKVS